MSRRPPHVAREHEFEAQPGLPEPLPASEHLLWQGSPRWDVLARRVFHADKVAMYFALLLAWRVAVLTHDGASLGEALHTSLWLLPLAGLGVGLLLLLAWLTARATLYTLTERRIVMRIGIVLTVAYNLPLQRIESADLHESGRGVCDIVLTLEPETRIAWLHLWPHVRPWRVARPRPMLRALPDAQAVSALLAVAWSEANGTPARPATAATPPRASAPRHSTLVTG